MKSVAEAPAVLLVSSDIYLFKFPREFFKPEDQPIIVIFLSGTQCFCDCLHLVGLNCPFVSQ
jgi:hypothetical protein